MRYNGIFAAFEVSQAVSAAGPLIELQVPANTIIEIIRVWIGAAEGATPVDETQDVQIYGNDAVATGGVALTEQALQGVDDTTGVVALGGPTIGATETVLYPDGFHFQNGWLYLPVPEERIRVVGAATIDNVGVQFISAPQATSTISYGIIWGEMG